MHESRVASHYTRGDLAARIEAGLEALGKGSGPLTPEDLAPVDEFHVGGRAATEHLMAQLGLRPGLALLDVGSGLGGASRYAALQHGCRVTGIDLTPEYCAVATRLAERVGLAGRVSYRQGSALALPFDARAFEAATLLHVGMNIADKRALFREIARVLAPGSVLGVYDILRGENPEPLTFPVPWAGHAELSFLATPVEMRAALAEAGFEVERVEERRAFAMEFFARLGARGTGGPPPLGLHLVMGPDFPVKVANMVANVGDGRCAPWEMICRRR